MKLITECSQDVEYIVEGKNKQQYIKGIFMQSDIQNQNGRVYPYSVLQKEVKNYNNKFVKESRALGELGHPAGPQSTLTEFHILSQNFMKMVKTS